MGKTEASLKYEKENQRREIWNQRKNSRFDLEKLKLFFKILEFFQKDFFGFELFDFFSTCNYFDSNL